MFPFYLCCKDSITEKNTYLEKNPTEKCQIKFLMNTIDMICAHLNEIPF